MQDKYDRSDVAIIILIVYSSFNGRNDISQTINCTLQRPFASNKQTFRDRQSAPRLIGPSLQAVGDIRDIARCRSLPITQVTLVDRTRVVQTQSAVDSRSGILVVQLLEIGLEMLCARQHHRVDLILWYPISNMVFKS